MTATLSIKELRENIAQYADQVEKGKSFIVMRRSKPAFRIVPYNDDEGYETLIDFTEGGKKSGISAKKLLQIMTEFEKKYGSNHEVSKNKNGKRKIASTKSASANSGK